MSMIPTDSGLDPIDEQEPADRILADLQSSIRQVKLDQTSPISELWDNVNV